MFPFDSDHRLSTSGHGKLLISFIPILSYILFYVDEHFLLSLTCRCISASVLHRTQGLIFLSKPTGDAAGGALYDDLHVQLLLVLWMHNSQEVEIKEEQEEENVHRRHCVFEGRGLFLT